MKLRTLASLSLFAAALSANAAVSFAFQTEGEYSEPASILSTLEGSATYRANHDANLTVTSVSYTLTEASKGATGFPGSQITGGSGTIQGLYLGLAYTLSFTVGTGTVLRSSNTTLNRSFAGDIITFTISGPSALNGMYGVGTFGGTLLSNQTLDSGISKTSFDLEAVPEPASMAALGLGLAGIAARRRRK